ncbi:MAG TPA: MurR/RpiR family transcriptional regulator [Anaerolineaceae bacterium]|nr:MurR/RpiR family transcriptional regulator [Longilinea sp.]NMD31351.1 MurR/RpiR family transcriptional regulator [Chloroflexota bacterium]HOD43868.1 MurR/RpiR family transcriptional regulator [Anaerolineaceae bacterium]HOH20136.1 MurR/RpiR family transcriptional regulator [Anaerolineaceae bacterium]HOU43578.1 MurR/RpiR family transcriptional regulator [Anaerolineaceae bacterium]
MTEDGDFPGEDFPQIISKRYNDLTKSEKRIADYIRKNQDECAFLSAGELAARLDLSEATLVRFARTLGFASYPAMREILQRAFRSRVTHSVRLRGRLEELRESGDFFERLVISEMDYMTQALSTVDRESLEQATELLRTRKKVFVYGVGPSISLVDLMEIRLGRFGRQVVTLTTAGREILEPLILMNDQDLLFVICFFDVSPTLQFVLDYANEVHCPVIMLTDTLGSMIGNQAEVVLAARRGPVSEFHSLVVPMTIINALLLMLASEDPDEVTSHLDKLDQFRERLKNLNKSSLS